MNEILRRKLRRADSTEPEGGSLADQAWRLALVRSMRESAGLVCDVLSLASARRDLAELPELLPERALIALLDGPGGAMGMLALSSEVMTSLIEMQTTGKVSVALPAPRRPTRTDAAMVSGVIDRALMRFDMVLREREDSAAAGFRYASFLEDSRTLGLLLEDQPWRVFSAELSVGDGRRSGSVLLALPALLPALNRETKPRPGKGREATMAGILAPAPCMIDAVLARLHLPLSELMALAPGRMLVLEGAALDRITLQGSDGKPVMLARLGQQRGARALRLSGPAGAEDQNPGSAASTGLAVSPRPPLASAPVAQPMPSDIAPAATPEIPFDVVGEDFPVFAADLPLDGTG